LSGIAGVSRTNPWTTLITQFKASPGRSGLLALLALVLVVVLVRQVVKGPQSAGAALPAAPAPIARTVEPAKGPAAAQGAAPDPAPRPPLPDLPDHPSRDLFAADWSLFARMPRANDPVPPGDQESSPEAGPGLTLELTLTGPSYRGHPCAVINGRTVRVGEVIEGWVVESISSREVILSAPGQERMALRMK
jgi:hypothetical protein